MALIKCTECGHDVSDKASECPHCGCPISKEKSSICKECGEPIPENVSVCPNCGCPLENIEAVQEVYYDEEPEKKKWWIWALVIALLCLGGGYYAYTKLFNGESDKDAIAAIVELTPEFAKSLEVYDELGPFNEGYAAVRRGKKWGYINTKGEEVIPCSFDAADIFSEGLAAVSKSDKLVYINSKGEEIISSPYSYYNIQNRNFSEGLAAVCDDGKWGWINTKGELVIPLSIEAEDVGLYSEGLVYCQNSSKVFSFVDKNGAVVFKGKTNDFEYSKLHGGYYSKDFPKFRDDFVYVRDGFVYVDDVNTVCKYTKYDKQGKKCGTITENELPEYRLIYENEIGLLDTYTVGLQGKDGTVLIKPYYNMIETDDAQDIAQVSNGVVLVMLIEFSEYNDDVIYHYGYADLKGHDTFSKEIKDKVNKSRKGFCQKLQEEAEENERIMKEGPDWLQGAWKLELTDDYGSHLGYMYEVFNHGTSKSYINEKYLYEHHYTVSDDMIIYEKGHYQLDNTRQIVLGANGKEMQKISDDPYYTPNSSSSQSSSSSYSNNSSSSSKGYRFSSPQDVIGWLADKSFYNGNRRLRIHPNGVWLNDYCATGAPNVERWESWKALIRAYTATGERLSFFVDPINGTVTDEASDVFRLR